MKSGDTFVYWVSSKPAFLTLYVSQLSFPLRSISLPSPPSAPPPLRPFAVLYFLLTDSACLDQHSLRETRGARDVFIEKLRRHDSSNLTVTMGNAGETNMKREFLRRRVQPPFLRQTIRRFRPSGNRTSQITPTLISSLKVTTRDISYGAIVAVLNYTITITVLLNYLLFIFNLFI